MPWHYLCLAEMFNCLYKLKHKKGLMGQLAEGGGNTLAMERLKMLLEALLTHQFLTSICLSEERL